MAIDVTLLTDTDEWDELVETNAQATPFHRADSLEAIAEHSGATLYPYAGFKGHEPVGIFPIFEHTVGPCSVAMSPPPGLKISYLGPALLNQEKQKRRRQEKTNRRFIEACLDAVSESIDPVGSYLRTGFEYADPRPFLWNGFRAEPQYTYLVDIEPDESTLLGSFSSDARRNIRTADGEYQLSRGGADEIRRTIDALAERHAKHDVPFRLPSAFVCDLYHRLPEGVVRLYTCRVDGRLVGGHLTLENAETIYGWQSWADLDADVPVNDLLDWEIMTTARDRGIRWYDLVGANIPRLSAYKSKFGPELRTYQRIDTNSLAMTLASKLYARLG